MNLANKITIVRICIIPVILFFILAPLPYGTIIAGSLFLLASVSDWLDGHIARKYDMVTNFGKIMDPLADKLLVLSVLICLIQTGVCPAWCVVIIIARELLVTSLRIVAVGDGKVIAASMWGKVKTTIQLIAVSFALFFGTVSFVPQAVTLTILILATVFTAISGIAYIIENKEVFQ